MIEHATEQTRTPWLIELIVAMFALATLLLGHWMLSTVIHGSNYYGPDGMMAQALALAAVKFAGIFDVTNLSPINGVASQMLPKNLWTKIYPCGPSLVRQEACNRHFSSYSIGYLRATLWRGASICLLCRAPSQVSCASYCLRPPCCVSTRLRISA